MAATFDPFPLPDEQATFDLGARFAAILSAGDVILLEGDIGAGKSAFSRAIIQSMAGARIDVPSPTFTLVQTYDLPQAELWHADLYRLTSPDEAIELGLEDAFDTAICLIEWPDRLGDVAPDHALRLLFVAHETAHSVTVVSAPSAWRDRLDKVFSK